MSKNSSEAAIAQKIEDLHQKILTLDSHVDTPLRLILESFDISRRYDSFRSGPRVDFARMREGGLDAAFFAVFIDQGDRSAAAHRAARNNAENVIAAIRRSIDRNAQLAELALTPDDAYRIKAAAKRAVFIGLENGYPIGSDLSLIEHFYDLGARYITLCHIANNEICDSSATEPEHNGLSEFGRAAVREMNRLGMIIDLSHASDKTFYDVLKQSKAPVVASHSCARALCDHKRNLDDDMLRTLARNGGVIQMCIFSDFVKTPAPFPERDAAIEAAKQKFPNYAILPPRLKQIEMDKWDRIDAEYIDHIVKIAGIDHVGIGTDLDGGGEVEGCRNVSEMKNITRELLRRGYADSAIEKIWGANFMRVFREVERIAGKG